MQTLPTSATVDQVAALDLNYFRELVATGQYNTQTQWAAETAVHRIEKAAKAGWGLDDLNAAALTAVDTLIWSSQEQANIAARINVSMSAVPRAIGLLDEPHKSEVHVLADLVNLDDETWKVLVSETENDDMLSFDDKDGQRVVIGRALNLGLSQRDSQIVELVAPITEAAPDPTEPLSLTPGQVWVAEGSRRTLMVSYSVAGPGQMNVFAASLDETDASDLTVNVTTLGGTPVAVWTSVPAVIPTEKMTKWLGRLDAESLGRIMAVSNGETSGDYPSISDVIASRAFRRSELLTDITT